MHTLLLSAALALGAGEFELLEFTTANCPACAKLAPALDRVAASGLTVRKIDAGQRPDLARQFRVSQVPTTILVRHGLEIDRFVGAVEWEQLTTWLSAKTRAPAADARERGPQPPTVFANASAPQQGASSNAERAALAATVRLKVTDAQGQSFGTGTIIDRHGEEALVITCAHIFRESQGKGEIQVDVFAAHAPTAAGQLIDCDLHKDVALIAFRPPVDIRPVAVAGVEFASQPGEAVFSIGCDRGAPPSVIRSQVAGVNKFNGRPNVTVKGQPVDGRSGGGLFLPDGRLIGICNAADAVDNEGLYASLPAIHGELDRIGQGRIYQRPNGAPTQLVAAAAPQPIATQAAAVAPPQAPAADLEILCVVRSKSQPNLPPQVFALDQLPAEVQQRLAAGNASAPGASTPRLATQPARSEGLLIRAQQ